MLCFCFGLLAFVIPATATAQSECARIDKTKAPLFISFERFESKDVLLRLHNNSGCPVLVPTNELDSTLEFVKLSNGGSIAKYAENAPLRDGRQVRLVYNLINLRGRKDVVNVSDGCIVMSRRLLPQQTVVFSVPLEDFRNHADVLLEFSYPWEYDEGSAAIVDFGHSVVFRNANLPQPSRREVTIEN